MGKPKERNMKTVNNSSFCEMQRAIRKQLAFSTCPEILEGLHEEKRLLKELLTRTVVFGENNSVLLIGQRGCGKTALVNQVREELHELPDFSTNCIIIDLNGLIHTDDRIALKNIIYQLKLQNSIDGKGNFADALTFLLETLKSDSHYRKTILFILDEFDLFCQKKSQTLLYNLFDIAHSSQISVAIIGLTSRLDVLELLEKRVKSRFSHRILHLFIQLNFENYVNIAKNLLYLPKEFAIYGAFREEWNTHIKKLLDERALRNIFKRLYDTSRDVRALKKFLLLPMSVVNENHRHIDSTDFLDSQEVYILESRADMLLDLSVLEFSLILTMMHLNSVHDGEPLNFEIIYHEFQQYVQKKAALQQLSKTAVMKAFEHLLSLELVKVVDGHVINSQKNYQIIQLLLVPSQIQEALQRYPNLPTDLQHWACNILS